MAEIAALGLRIDGISDVKKGGDALDKLAKSADGAARSQEKLAASSDSAKSGVKSFGEEAAKAGAVVNGFGAGVSGVGAKQRDYNKSMYEGALSAKQMSAALRGVPAQFTDIAVALQAGQSPLTVLLQQGGQLKDMFGGVGAASRALGGYVLGLLNPISLLIGAIGSLGFAYFKGSQEVDAFRRALVITGNQVGLTTNQLQNYAAQMGSVIGSQAKATEALNAFINAGFKGSEGLKEYAETAIKWERATGQSVDEVAAKFVALQKDPVAAVIKLQEATGFLTADIYKQIVELNNHGESAKAAALAMGVLSSAMATGSENIVKNLGYIESAWDGVKNAAKGAWDYALSIGRPGTLEEESKKLAAIQNRVKELGSSVGNYHKNRLKDQEELVAKLKKQEDFEKQQAKNTEERGAKVKAQKDWQEIANKYKSDEKKLSEEIAAIQRTSLAAGADQVETQRIINKLKDDYNKKNAPQKTRVGGGGGGVSELASIMARVKATKEYTSALREKGKEAERMTEGEVLASKIQAEIDSGKLKSVQLLAKTKELAAAKELQAAQEEQRREQKAVEEREKMAQREKAAAIDKFNLQYQLQERIMASQERYQSATAAYGMGSKAGKESAERISIQQQQQKELRDMAQQHQQEMRAAETEGERAHLQSMYQQRVGMLQATFQQEIALYDEYLVQKQEKEANAALGVQQAMQDFLDNSQNLYQQAQDMTTSLLEDAQSKISDGFMAILDGSKSAGDAVKDMARGMAQSVIKALVDMAAQWLVYKAVQMFVGKSTQSAGAGALSANAAATSMQAGIAAFASTAAIPVVGPALAPAAMAAAISATAPVAAAIGAMSLTGMAHDGIDSVPREGTWLLDKGERVMTANTSAKMDGVLERIDARQRGAMSGGAAGGGQVAYAAPIINIIEDSSKAGQVTSERDAAGNYSTDIFVSNIMRGGDEARVLESTYNLKRLGT